MKTIECHCSAKIEIDVPELIDLDIDASRFEQLKDGTFLTIVCPHCGATIRPEVPIRLISASNNLNAMVLPELERLTVYRGKANVPHEVEILIGYPELFERARILRDGQEANTIEIIKYYLQSKAEEQEPEADITVLYHRLEAGKLSFHILGMKSGQTGVINLPLESVSRYSNESFNKNPRFSLVFSGQYRSIKKLWFYEEEEPE